MGVISNEKTKKTKNAALRPLVQNLLLALRARAKLLLFFLLLYKRGYRGEERGGEGIEISNKLLLKKTTTNAFGKRDPQ